MTVKRVLTFLSGLAVALLGPFGRMPAWAQLLMLGVGGAIGAAILTPPTLTPQLSAQFDSNISNGTSNNGFKVNGGGAIGSMELPSTISHSWFQTVEGTTDAYFSGSVANQEYALANVMAFVPVNNMMIVLSQFNYPGQAWNWWRGLPSTTPATGLAGSGYNSLIYPWTATGGGCAREPSGVWWGNSTFVAISDYGANCNTAPSIAAAAIPGVGAKQALSTGATTCVSNSPIAGEMTVTTTVAIAHGVYPGQTFPLSGFSGAGNTGYNATYTALAGTSGTTLVGETTTGAGTCPANSPDTSGGFALAGTGAAISLPQFTNTSPFASNGGQGILFKNNDHFCAIIGQYGDDSPTPGVQFFHVVDQNGTAYNGAPSVPAILNQGAVSFNGYVTSTAQDTSFNITASFGNSGASSTTMTVTVASGNPLLVGQTILGSSVAPNTTIVSQSSGTTGGPGTYVVSTSNVMPSATYTAHTYAPALTVTSMNSVSISGATWSSANNGTVTFTAAANWIQPGSVFTVSGATPSGYNGTYIAGVGTNGTGTTIAAVSWPVATLANPGAYVSGGSFVGTIEPGMYMPGVNGQVVISPYGTFGGSGTGGAGTYGFTETSNSGFNITASISGTTLTVTASPYSTFFYLTPGQTFTSAGGVAAGTKIVAQTSGTGGNTGNYTVDTSQTVGSQTLTLSGAIYSSGTPGILYASGSFYQWPSPSYTNAWLGQNLAHTQAGHSDISSVIGSKFGLIGTGNSEPWGGALGNIGMHWGVFPQDSSGNPSTSSLASLCQKTTDYQAFDTANSITTNSLYRMNDPGEWGDSSYATITGYLSGASGTSGGSATLNVVSTVFGTLALPSGTHTAFLAGPGLPPSPTPASVNPASMLLTTSSSSTYTVTFPTGVTSINLGSSGAPVQFSVGQWKPLAPLGTGFVNGYITTSGGSGACASSPCLNVTSIPTGANQLGSTFTGTYNPALATNNFTVSGVTGTLTTSYLITDGGVNISNQQPLVMSTANCSSTCTVTGGYYQSTIGPETMTATLSAVNLNQMVYGAGVNTPVQIVGYGSGTTIPQAGSTYVLSNSANGNVGSSGSPVLFTLSSISGGGAIAPGPALTVSDPGAGTMYAVTNYPSSSPTGAITLKGTYNTTSLGGTPSSIQAQLSLTPGGTAVAGFSWANLSSQTISGGNWSGSLPNVPPGVYWVSIRAANGTAYATLRNFVTVGAPAEMQGEGNPGAYVASTAGNNNVQSITGVNAVVGAGGQGPAVYGPALGSNPSGNKLRLAFSQGMPANRFSGGLTLPEGPTQWNQAFWNATGTGFGQNNSTISAGIGSIITQIGNQPQITTIGIGNGSTTAYCSSSIYCNVAAMGLGSTGSGILSYSAAGLTGATVTGSVATAGGVSTLTVTAIGAGAIEPGLELTGTNVIGSPTITTCVTNCVYAGAGGGTSTWLLSTNQGTIGSQAFNLTVSGGTPWPNVNLYYNGGQFAKNGTNSGQVIKYGTFSLTVNGTQVCSDASTFSYSAQGGTCAGAGIASSFINYATGDYEIVFSSPPANNAIILASWTNIVSHNATGADELVDVVGDGSATTGGWSSTYEKLPGGGSAHIYAGCVQDYGQFLFQGYALGAIGLSQQISWFYGPKLRGVIPNQQNVPLLMFGMWRYQGNMNTGTIYSGYLFCDQWFHDMATPSTFTGTVTGGGTSSPILTLNSAVTGSLWEGEALGCNPYSTACSGMGGATTQITLGTQITGLLSGTWGANGSTYSLTAPGGPTAVVNVSSQPMTNAVYYTGGGPAYYVDGAKDAAVQQTAAAGAGGVDGHPWSGITGGRRIGARAGILAAAALSNNPSLASEPTLSRTKIAACDAAALAAPCFDIGSTYAASATATWSGATATITGGLAANARPFVPGMALSCSGCNSGLYIVSVSAPPTQSTVSGAGQISNTFTVKASGTIGGSGSGTITGGCSGTSGTGSNCIDFSFALNTTGATSLATCGVNNLFGTAALYTPPNGFCKDPGVGELVNSFRIGTQQVTVSAWSPLFRWHGLRSPARRRKARRLPATSSAQRSCNASRARPIAAVCRPGSANGRAARPSLLMATRR